MIKVVVSVIVGMALTSAILVRVSQEENQEKNTSSSSESSGISVLFGLDKKAQTFILDRGWYDPISGLEEKLR